jgi:hypothetical protein
MDFALTERTTTHFLQACCCSSQMSSTQRRKRPVSLKIDFFLLLKEEDRTWQAVTSSNKLFTLKVTI